MTQQSSFAGPTDRKGTGLLPPNPKQWQTEHNGLDLRAELGVALSDPLDHYAAFALLPHVTVHPHGAIPAADVYLHYFRREGSAAWSGLSITLADGHELVFFNDAHPATRIRATLMEEYFHIRLDHPRSAIRLHSEDGRWRTFNSSVEDEAYHSGAAALVPYRALKNMLASGQRVGGIATHFRVSHDLVIFRMKVTRCYRMLRR
jgi:hypothetical protein